MKNQKPNDRNLFIGLMSGTSGDGLDIAICEFTGPPSDPSYNLLNFQTVSYQTGQVSLPDHTQQLTVENLSEFNVSLGRKFGDAVVTFLNESGLESDDIVAIGSHGHTVYHNPRGNYPSTFQVGEGAEIAEKTGIPVICDFRPGDIAAGGEGAPLLPLADWLLWQNANRARFIINLGGFSNTTYLPKNSDQSDVVAFDIGPCNRLLNYLARRTETGEFDPGGRTALGGTAIDSVVSRALDHKFFTRKPPRSTGRTDFDKNIFDSWFDSVLKQNSAEDVLATGATIIAKTIRNGLALVPHQSTPPPEVILTGGGTENKALVNAIQKTLDFPVKTGDRVGVEIHAREAIGFALFAWLAEIGHYNNLPHATGASHPCVLGKRIPPVGRPVKNNGDKRNKKEEQK